MRVRVAHISLQYSDGPQAHTDDIERIFDRAVDRRIAWVTGTESGPGANNTSDELVRISREHDYRPYVPSAGHGEGSSTDCWVAVREDLITDNWETDFLPAIPGSKEFYERKGLDPSKIARRWGPRGLVAVAFDCEALKGRVNIGAAHYLTDAHDPDDSVDSHGIDHWELNGDLAEVVGDWAREVGHGRDLAFYAGDQNMADSKNDTPQGDTFFGEPLTSLADELSAWKSSGHGPIDVIASYNRDRRVVGVRFMVLDDSRFHLHTDHFYTEGVFDVAEPNRA